MKLRKLFVLLGVLFATVACSEKASYHIQISGDGSIPEWVYSRSTVYSGVLPTSDSSYYAPSSSSVSSLSTYAPIPNVKESGIEICNEREDFNMQNYLPFKLPEVDGLFIRNNDSYTSFISYENIALFASHDSYISVLFAADVTGDGKRELLFETRSALNGSHSLYVYHDRGNGAFVELYKRSVADTSEYYYLLDWLSLSSNPKIPIVLMSTTIASKNGNYIADYSRFYYSSSKGITFTWNSAIYYIDSLTLGPVCNQFENPVDKSGDGCYIVRSDAIYQVKVSLNRKAGYEYSGKKPSRYAFLKSVSIGANYLRVDETNDGAFVISFRVNAVGAMGTVLVQFGTIQASVNIICN